MIQPNLIAPTLLAFGARKKAASPKGKAPAAKTPEDAFVKKTATKKAAPKKAAPAPKTAKAAAVKGPAPTPYDKIKLSDAEIIVFDIETTGVKARADKDGEQPPEGGWDDLTELSAIKYKNGIETGRFYGMVKPRKRIPAEVEEKTNITNAMVEANGRPTEVVMTEFFDFIGDNTLTMGHNAKWFDTKFLRAICQRYNFPEMKERLQYDHVVDTMQIARKLFPDCVWTYDANGQGIPPTPGPNSPKDLKLTSLAEFFGFDTTGAHRAENDVAMAAKIFQKMVDRIKEQGIPMETYGDVYKYQYTQPKRWNNKKPAATPQPDAPKAETKKA